LEIKIFDLSTVKRKKRYILSLFSLVLVVVPLPLLEKQMFQGERRMVVSLLVGSENN
jgi:hypothetical protein